MPRLEDTLVLDESFFIYSRARDVNIVITPNVEETIDSQRAKNIQIDELLEFYFSLGQQLALEDEMFFRNG